MKPLQVFFTIIVTLLFTSCFKEKENPPIKYYAIGVYYPNIMTIKTDFDTELIVTNSTEINIKNDDPVRVLAYFFVEEQVSDFTLKVNVTSIYDISVPLVVINENNLDSLERNDAIRLNSTWIAQDYLSLDFIFWAYEKPHNFFFSLNPEDQIDDKIVLKFHHNANKDYGYKLEERETVVSLPIKEFKNPQKDSVLIKFSYYNSSSTFLEDSIWYSY